MDYTKEQIKLITEELNPVDTQSLYDEMLSECYDTVNICGLEYDAGQALEQVDPTAYRCGHIDYIDSLINDSLSDEIEDGHYWLSEVEALLEGK